MRATRSFVALLYKSLGEYHHPLEIPLPCLSLSLSLFPPTNYNYIVTPIK